MKLRKILTDFDKLIKERKIVGADDLNFVLGEKKDNYSGRCMIHGPFSFDYKFSIPINQNSVLWMCHYCYKKLEKYDKSESSKLDSEDKK